MAAHKHTSTRPMNTSDTDNAHQVLNFTSSLQAIDPRNVQTKSVIGPRLLEYILVNNSIPYSNSTISANALDPYSFYYKDGRAGRQDYIAAAIPVLISILSILGCYIIMRESWADYRKSQQTYTRRQDSGSAALILQNFLAAACYFLYAFMLVWGPLPAPAEVPFSWTRGTQATCSAQGFLVQVGVTSAALEHSFLIWMYVLLVRYNWSERSLRRCVSAAAGVTSVLSLGMATIPAILGYYNYNSETKCWIATFPYQCNDYDNTEVDCIRGASANQLQMLYFLFPHWLLLICDIICICLIWCTARKLENTTAKYGGSAIMNMRQQSHEGNAESSSRRSHGDTTSRREDSSLRDAGDTSDHAPSASRKDGDESKSREEHVEVSVNRTKSKAIATQGILFSFIFVAPMVVASLEILFKVVTGWSTFWLAQISNAFIAIPGLLFFLVFCHPREKTMRTAEGRFVRRYVLGYFFVVSNKVFGYFVRNHTKTRVSLKSSIGRHGQRSSQFDKTSQNMVESQSGRPNSIEEKEDVVSSI